MFQWKGGIRKLIKRKNSSRAQPDSLVAPHPPPFSTLTAPASTAAAAASTPRPPADPEAPAQPGAPASSVGRPDPSRSLDLRSLCMDGIELQVRKTLKAPAPQSTQQQQTRRAPAARDDQE
jgi:hypothetical protein